MTKRAIRLAVLGAMLPLMQAPALQAADAIQVATAQLPAPTQCCISIVLPIQSGDDDHDAVASVEYRAAGASLWRPALPLLRVRPETLGAETPPGDYGLPDPSEQFAGSIFGLEPGTGYEVRVSVTDPDGGATTQSLQTTTPAVPRTDPQTPRYVPVSTTQTLASALANAQAGDVIDISAGSYTGPFTLAASGTTADPIVVRGIGASQVTINAVGASYGIVLSGSHVHLEGITVSGSDWGAQLSGATDIVVRNTRFTQVNKGIDARFGSHTGFYICDNVLQGKVVWPNVSNTTWNEEGIVITGRGHTVCHNELSGFGDALGINQNTSIINESIDFYGNDVLWTGDDGLEIDYGHRNIRIFENRLTNTSMGVSVQPSWGGPIYIVRNVMVNIASAPYKFNNDPTGIIVLNNTSVRTTGQGNYGGSAWPQLGYTQADGAPAYVANLQFMNNLLIGRTGPNVTSALQLATIDYNGWSPDGTFTFVSQFTNLADVAARSAYEHHGRIVGNQPFAAAIVLGSDYTTFTSPQDATLGVSSNAVDGGLALPNVADQFTGAAPDLGALERGMPAPTYGPRGATSRPNPPTNLSVQ